MGFLKKIFGGEIPEWAQPANQKIYSNFQSDILDTFRELGIQAEFDWSNGLAKVEIPSHTIAVQNIFKEWIESDPNSRKEIAKNFIHAIQSIDMSKPEVLAEKLDSLMLKIYDFEYPHIESGANRPIGKFLRACLAIDNGQTITSIPTEHIANQNLDEESLFKRAKENLWKQITPQIGRRDLPNGQATFIVASFYGASFITMLDRFTEVGKTYWVATPTRDITLLFEPTDISLESKELFLDFANQISHSSPNYYILPFLLEYKDGEFRDLCGRGEGSIHIAD